MSYRGLKHDYTCILQQVLTMVPTIAKHEGPSREYPMRRPTYIVERILILNDLIRPRKQMVRTFLVS